MITKPFSPFLPSPRLNGPGPLLNRPLKPRNSRR